jgi:Ran GTPase-activating protein (RanGAP) involved in mRNA processing and transport
MKGMTAICEAMASNTVLESLVLDTNNLGDEGAEAIASVLASKRAADFILLSYSSFSLSFAFQLNAPNLTLP